MINSQSTWPGQTLFYFHNVYVCIYICREILRCTICTCTYLCTHTYTHTHTHAQIRCYKSLVDVSIVNLKDDSRSKLPAVFDTKKLQEHFERCYWPVPSQSAMRPIKQSDAMYLESQTDVTVYGIPRH